MHPSILAVKSVFSQNNLSSYGLKGKVLQSVAWNRHSDGTKWGKSICCKVEYNGYLRAQCQRCWEGWEFLYLGRLVRTMFPWLQKSCGGGEPDAEQTKRISSPREKTWLWGWITTEGASANGVKQRQNADDHSVNAWWCGSRCRYQQSLSFWLVFLIVTTNICVQ